MGCCCSKDEQLGESDSCENTRLLGEQPINGTITRVSNVSQNSSFAESAHNNNQMLNAILHDIAGQLIDVSAADSETFDHLDHKARAKIYSTKLREVMPSLSPSVHCVHIGDVPGVPVPHLMLSTPPCQQADIIQVTAAADRFAAAVHSMKVVSKDQIVVPLLSNQ